MYLTSNLRTNSQRKLAGMKRNKPRYGTPKRKRGTALPEAVKQFHARYGWTRKVHPC